VRLTERDAAILRDVGRFGALTIEQVGWRHFASVPTAYGRLKALARSGYLELVRVWHGRPGTYVATAEGTRTADVALPPARVAAATLAHHLAVADLAARLLAEHPGARHPGARWVTERELRRDAMAAARERGTGRLFGGVPRVPDGVLVLPDGRRVAVEVELSAKGSARYRSVLGWYATALGFARVRWFVADRPLRDRLEALARAERLDDLVSVEPLPDVLVPRRRPATAAAGTLRAHWS
jgi:Replication-relaxation